MMSTNLLFHLIAKAGQVRVTECNVYLFNNCILKAITARQNLVYIIYVRKPLHVKHRTAPNVPGQKREIEMTLLPSQLRARLKKAILEFSGHPCFNSAAALFRGCIAGAIL